MPTYLYLSDIHANYQALSHLTQLPEFSDPDCQIRFGGNYIDGYHLAPGATIATLRFIKDLCDSGKAKAILGNHDQFLIDATYYPYRESAWYLNGREATLKNLGIPYSGDDEYLREQLLYHYPAEVAWLRSLPYYLEDGNNILTHAGFDLAQSLRDQDTDTLIWVRDPYVKAYRHLAGQIHADFLGKTLVTGHTPTRYLLPEGSSGSPILTHQWDVTQYFIDGGSKSGSEHGSISVLKLDQDGQLLDAWQLDETGVHPTTIRPLVWLNVQDLNPDNQLDLNS